VPDTTITYYTTHVKNLVKRYESADVPDLHTFLADSFPPGARLLELGCGSGRDAAFMLENGFDVTASDGVREMFDAAAACHPALAEWTGLCRRAGFEIPTSTPTSDGLGRKTFAWLNCLAVTDRKNNLY
jgi:SAM-dependent methyltransferase